VREADDLITFMCRMSWKSGSLNLLEHSGPHRACYGTALAYSQMFVLLCGFYIACLNSYMFRLLYRPSSGWTLSYYKAHCKICNGFVFVHQISCTSVKFPFKMITLQLCLTVLHPHYGLYSFMQKAIYRIRDIDSPKPVHIFTDGFFYWESGNISDQPVSW